jgi:hypothetical protein
MREIRNSHIILVETLFGRPGRIWKCNVEMDLRGIGWIQLAPRTITDYKAG